MTDTQPNEPRICKGCGKSFPVSEYLKYHANGKEYTRTRCVECWNKYSRPYTERWNQKHPGRAAEISRQWRQAHKGDERSRRKRQTSP